MLNNNLLPLSLPSFLGGEVWLAGAGPGDPGLLTILALHAINNADIILHDALVSSSILELAPDNVKIELAGKRAGKCKKSQDDINHRLIELARMGKRVLRLKGGDPLVFARGGEEMEALVNASIKFRIIPGVSAGIAAPAYAGIPISHRDFNSSIIFITGHSKTGNLPQDINWQAISKPKQVTIFFMALNKIKEISTKLIENNLDENEKIAIICNASLDNQKTLITTIGNSQKQVVEKYDLKAPAIIIIGKNIDKHHTLDWLNADKLVAI